MVEALPVRAFKAMPPRLAAPHIPRPELERRLDEAITRRLTIVVGDTGFGKTTALAAWASRRRSAWYTLEESDRALAVLADGLLSALRLRLPGSTAGGVARAESGLGPEADDDVRGRGQARAAALLSQLRAPGDHDLVLVLDDLHVLGADGPALWFVEALCRQAPSWLRIVIASRRPPAFPVERLRSRGQLAEIDGGALAMTADEVRRLVEATLGDALVAAALHDLTGGWPAAVRLAVDGLARVPPARRVQALDTLKGRRGPLRRYLVAELVDREPETVRRLLATVAPLPAFDAELCAALGVPDAQTTIAALELRASFLQPSGGDGWYRLAELVRGAAADLPGDDPGATRAAALAHLEAGGSGARALELAVAAGDEAAMTRLLATRGEELLVAGAVDLVARACAALPADRRDSALEQLFGEALQVRGQWGDALACFERAGAAAEALPAALAWRMGLMHYLRGDLDRALAVFDEGVLDGREPADEARLLAWAAAVLWRRGDVDGCRERADRALMLAAASGDDQALAAGHTAKAMLAAIEGDRRGNDAHYLHALDAAGRAGDVLQLIRIRTNRASHFLDEGYFEEARAEAETAIELADPAGYAAFHALALTNRGEALLHLGRLDEATADFRAAQAIEERLASLDVRYPLLRLGDVYLARGDTTLARSVYAEAAALAAEQRDQQSLVPALAGLARTHLADDPSKALHLAEEAVAAGPGMGRTEALLAAGWAALATGDGDRAVDVARAARDEAAQRRDRPHAAESLELIAGTAGDRDRARAALEEAVALWAEIGDPIGEARARLRLARIGDRAEGRAVAARLEQRLRQAGARSLAAEAAAVAAGEARDNAGLRVCCLGGFRVVRGGVTVPVTAWQSRKARDLLKVLVARRARPTPRETLIEHLWPEQADQSRLANRLSVALSTARTVLDPERRHPPDWYLTADKTAVGLDLDHLEVDVETFLSGAERALALRSRGKAEEASALLAAVEPLYGGDFLEEDPHEDWAVGLRELARATYISVVRALADDAAETGDQDTAARLYLRLLERDRYDEQAHLCLVATLAHAGRHGEAQRSYRTYVARMDELDVEAAPFPA